MLVSIGIEIALLVVALLSAISIVWWRAPHRPLVICLVCALAAWICRFATPPIADDIDVLGPYSVITTSFGFVGLVLYSFRRSQPWAANALLILGLGLIVALIAPVRTNVRPVARRMQCLNNLHNVVLALHNYAIVNNGALPPPGIEPADLSWRVQILPLIDESALYRAYHRDKPWDDPANDEFAKHQIKVYWCPSNPQEKDAQGRYYSSYAALTGPGTAFVGPHALTLDEIGTAGELSKTILFVEACGANIVWNEPRDIPTDQRPAGVNLPGPTRGTSGGWLSTYHKETANIAFADGSVHSISANIDPAVLKALSTVDPQDNPKDGKLP